MAKTRVLLAESTEFGLELLKDFFRQTEAQIFTAQECGPLLKQAVKVRPDLIVIDQQLPGGDALQCCRTLKQDPELGGTPLILLTSATGPEELQACQQTGCDEVIGKPLDRKRFLEVCRVFLDRVDRREPRILCRSTVVCRRAGESFYGTIEDLSPHGMFVGSDHPIKINDELQLKFILPWHEGSVVTTESRVTWLNGKRSIRKSKLPQGFGVEFISLSEESLDAICDYMEYCLLRRHPLED